MSFMNANLVLLSQFSRHLEIFSSPIANTPAAHGRIVGVVVSVCRELSTASLESFAFVLDRRATECAGRCCAPEPE